MTSVIEYSDKATRDYNQDFVSWLSLSDSASIYVLADGMGGYSHGDIAAKVVSESIIEYVGQNVEKLNPTELLKDAISYANDCLMLKKLALSVKQMGSVIAILLIVENEAFITWLGDSRIYLYRNSMEVYRSKDHSVINELYKIETLRVIDLEKYSNIVTKSVMGTDKIDDVEIFKIKIEKGDVFVLCSDGVHKQFPVSLIAEKAQEVLTDMTEFSKVALDNISFLRVEIV